MGIVSWLMVGLIVGAAAKLIVPGKDPGGFFVTIAIGLAGAFVGGYAGSLFGLGEIEGFDLRSLSLATAGAIFLLLVFRMLKTRF